MQLHSEQAVCALQECSRGLTFRFRPGVARATLLWGWLLWQPYCYKYNMVLPDSMGSLICRFAMRPGCRRKQLLAHFDEKRGGCDAAIELPCDWCHDPKVG